MQKNSWGGPSFWDKLNQGHMDRLQASSVGQPGGEKLQANRQRDERDCPDFCHEVVASLEMAEE